MMTWYLIKHSDNLYVYQYNTSHIISSHGIFALPAVIEAILRMSAYFSDTVYVRAWFLVCLYLRRHQVSNRCVT